MTRICRPSNLLSSCYFGKEFPQSWHIFSSKVSSDWMINRCRKRLWQKYHRPSVLTWHLWLWLLCPSVGHFLVKQPFWRIKATSIPSRSTGCYCSVRMALHLIIAYITFGLQIEYCTVILQLESKWKQNKTKQTQPINRHNHKTEDHYSSQRKHFVADVWYFKYPQHIALLLEGMNLNLCSPSLCFCMPQCLSDKRKHRSLSTS